MNRTSAVEFPTNSRVHIGLAVKKLAEAIDFYRTLFGQEPTKTRPGYAKFEVVDPPVNLSLNEVGGPTGPRHPVAHFGIQVKSSDAVKQLRERLAAARVPITVEDNVTCCYAVQDKIWVADADGNKWEVFVVLNNDASQHESDTGTCCALDDEPVVGLAPGGCCR